MVNWLGLEMFDKLIDSRYRDTMTASLYLNDRASVHAERIPFPKNNLGYLASQLKIEHNLAHDALADTVVTAEVYRRMQRNFVSHFQMQQYQKYEQTLRKLALDGNTIAQETLDEVHKMLPEEINKPSWST